VISWTERARYSVETHSSYWHLSAGKIKRQLASNKGVRVDGLLVGVSLVFTLPWHIKSPLPAHVQRN